MEQLELLMIVMSGTPAAARRLVLLCLVSAASSARLSAPMSGLACESDIEGIFCVYVMMNYRGRECKYLSWRFSHTNPYVVFGYMPKERRDALWQEIQGKMWQDVATMATIQEPNQTYDYKKDSAIYEGAAGPSTAPAGAPGPSSAPSAAGKAPAAVDPATGKPFRV